MGDEEAFVRNRCIRQIHAVPPLSIIRCARNRLGFRGSPSFAGAPYWSAGFASMPEHNATAHLSISTPLYSSAGLSPFLITVPNPRRPRFPLWRRPLGAQSCAHLVAQLIRIVVA